MATNIRSGTPRYILKGIKDESGRPKVIEPELIPTHLAHVPLFTERGDLTPEIVSGATMANTYGIKSFDYAHKYANHQTVLANKIGGTGNAMMIQRLVPPGANAPASLRLSVDVIADDVPVYERASDGNYKLDQDGNKIPTGATVPGYILKWVVAPTIDANDDGRLLETGDPRLLESGVARVLETKIGAGIESVGFLTNAAGEQSTLYPILDFEASSFGDFGNNIGIRLSAPTTKSTFPVNDAVIEDQRAYVYRIQIVENNNGIKVEETLFGERFVDFTLKEGVIDRNTELELGHEAIVIPSYSQEPIGGKEKVVSPIKSMHLYTTNLEKVLDLVQVKETPYNLISPLPEDKHMINIFTGFTYEGVPYEGIRVLGPIDNGAALNELSTHYLSGGFDGYINNTNFDLAVRHQFDNYGELDFKFLDTAMYPQSVVYDSGYSLETKKSLLNCIGSRKDIFVVLATQDVEQPQNTTAEEISIAIALKTRARMYPESEVYGTSTCRALVVSGSGYLVDNSYRKLLPFSIDIAEKLAGYMGAGTGFWNSNKRPDVSPNNQVSLFKGVNVGYATDNVRDVQWEAGMIWAQTFTRRTLFYPALQTVYDDDSSILNSAINMIIAVELEKIAMRTWRKLTGTSNLTPEQYIQRSNRLIEEEARGKFDGRAVIVAETYYTANDMQRGYSASCNIYMYGNNMKTVGSFTIVARRMSDLQG